MVTLLFVLWSIVARADDGFVTLSNGHRLWVEEQRAAPGSPTLYLINGLTYTTREWDAYVAEVRKEDPGIGIVRYDMRGMGETMKQDRRNYQTVTLEEQAEDLELLRRHHDPRGRSIAVGLSYGGAVALRHSTLYPEGFDQYVAKAPFLEPLPDMDRAIKDLIKHHRMWRWLDWRTDDELYAVYLRHMVFTTYPAAERVVLRDWPYKLEHIARLVLGARNWSASRMIPLLPAGKVHFVFARRDEYVSIASAEDFVRKLPSGLAASVLFMNGAKHKLPEVAPKPSAAWTLRIAHGDPTLKQGLTYELDAAKSAGCDAQLRILP